MPTYNIFVLPFGHVNAKLSFIYSPVILRDKAPSIRTMENLLIKSVIDNPFYRPKYWLRWQTFSWWSFILTELYSPFIRANAWVLITQLIKNNILGSIIGSEELSRHYQRDSLKFLLSSCWWTVIKEPIYPSSPNRYYSCLNWYYTGTFDSVLMTNDTFYQ